jgi:hypothetical protein
MSFVFPALLAGLVLTGVPLLLHLIMRRKPRRQPFPAFRYLVKRHRTNQRRLRLRHLLLLVLRIGLILLICLALARPRALNERLQLSSDRALAAVFLFDTSYSMEYAVANRSRLDEAKRRALELLDRLPEGSRVAILDSAENVESGRGEWVLNLIQARERISQLRLKPANQPVTTRLQSAYRLFAELASSPSPEQSLPRFLCVFSDRTLASWDAGKLSELHEARDAIPPSLERLQQFRDEVASLLSLLGDWPAAADPVDAKSLSEHLEKLRDYLGTLRVEEYPDRPTADAIAKVCVSVRGALARLRKIDEKAEPAVREYRDRAVKALQEALVSLRGVHEVFVDVAAERPDDLAVLGLELPRLVYQNQPKQVFNAGETIRLQAVVQATGRDFSTMLSIYLDQDRIPLQPAVELKAGEKRPIPVEINAELKPGPHQVEVRLATPDAMPFNNTRAVTFLIREPRKVLIVTDDPDSVGRWRLALELARKGPYQCEVVKADDAKLRADYLGQFSAVYLMSVESPSSKLWGALDGYVQKGGGLGIVPGAEVNDNAYNKNPTAQKLLPGEIKGIVEDKAGATWDLSGEAVVQHPMLARFREWRNDKSINFIRFPRRATYLYEVAPTPNQGEVLVKYAPKGYPALLERTGGDKGQRGGKVLLFTTRLDLHAEPFWNDYQESITSFYLVLATLSTKYLAGDEEAIPLNFTSGQTVPSLPLSFIRRLPTYQLSGPNLTESVTLNDDQSEARFAQAVTPGNYAVEDTDGSPVAKFSVTMPPEESSLEQVPAEQIEQLFGPQSVVPITYSTDLLVAISGHWRQPVELFPALMVALLLLLALENLLANKFYRRDPSADKEGS